MEKLRTMCINLTHYNLEQRKIIYDYLVSLNEPIFRNHRGLKWITDEAYTGKLEHVYAFTEYLGFSDTRWITLTKSEKESLDVKEVDLNTFISFDLNNDSIYLAEWLLK